MSVPVGKRTFAGRNAARAHVVLVGPLVHALSGLRVPSLVSLKKLFSTSAHALSISSLVYFHFALY